MATRTVTVCDICGTVLDMSQHMVMRSVVGSSYDGHRNEDDTALVDLCPEHFRAMRAAVDLVAGVHDHGARRIFNREQAEAVIVLLVQRWGNALATIPSVEGAA